MAQIFGFQMAANDLVTSHRKVVASSDRSFGLVFAGFFAFVALFPAIHGAPIRWWALIVAAVFAAIAMVRPRLLHPLNRVWSALGLLLHHVVNPEDAFRCFMGTELDMLTVGNCVLRKSEQDPSLKQDYRTSFDLD